MVYTLRSVVLTVLCMLTMACGGLGGQIRTPTLTRQPAVEGADSIQGLINEINDLLDAATHEGVAAIHIEQRAPAREIFALWSDRPMTPASNNKIQVTAAALHYLGADHTRTTRVVTNGEVDENGSLRGDLIIVGDGDPTIGGRFNDGNILGTIDEWIETLQEEYGIRSIDGRIIGDDDLFDDELIEESWFLDELGEWYSAESSALSLNDNCVDLHWRAGGTVGSPATFRMEPATTQVQIVNRVETVPSDASVDRYFHRDVDSSEVVATGGIPLGQSVTDWATVHNPTLFFASVVRESLTRHNITVTGEACDIDTLSRARVMNNLTELCATPSQPMSTIIDIVNQHSQNFYADMVLKLIGAEIEGDGSFDAGARAVQTFLADIGALPRETGAWRMVDGSGLSPLNSTTPRCLVTTLRHMDTRPDADVWRASLPRGRAERGSLARRFFETQRQRAMAPNILGKTGYIGGVWALSGVIENQAGAEFYYSIILNDYRSEVVPPLRLIDRIAVAVAASTFGADAPLDPDTVLH